VLSGTPQKEGETRQRQVKETKRRRESDTWGTASREIASKLFTVLILIPAHMASKVKTLTSSLHKLATTEAEVSEYVDLKERV
jgi:hypothetical protein